MKNEQESRLTLRLPEPLKKRLQEICDKEDRSLNWEIVQAIREYVERKEKHTREDV